MKDESPDDKAHQALAATMTRTVWKWVILFFALVLAGVTIYSFWPYWTASKAMQTFCKGVQPGSPEAQLRVAVETYGYTQTPQADGSLLVEDPVSFGRLKCQVRFSAGAVSGAEFSGGF